MPRYYDDYGYAPYVSVAERRAKAEKQAEKLKKKGADLQPIRLDGTKIAKSWWGIAWNRNLESYADYENRIGRGRTYVRNGCIIDLKISTGKITARVQGTSLYSVELTIDPMDNARYESLISKCGGRIESLEALTRGEFPKELETAFLTQREGLFPSPKEIHMQCSCPDWASMCKHVAAALYGVGARLDQDPMLFFTLRGIDCAQLIKKTADETLAAMLKNAHEKSKRALDPSKLPELFNLDGLG